MLKRVIIRCFWWLVLMPICGINAIFLALAWVYPWPESFILWWACAVTTLIGMRALKGALVPTWRQKGMPPPPPRRP